ncbi:MAG: tripartite tricarboxylate transporter substrate binding protein [Pseudolabrys sp.]|nr:tripartite tricarboxylate transporter substrate binding protein [Pseudolabrys sp.]
MQIDRWMGLAALAAMTLFSASVHAATDWPTRQVTIVVPTGAGGNTDLMARLAAQHLSVKFGRPFIVENRPGAGGAVASGQVANAAPDGYTIMFTPNSMILLTPLVQKMPFDPDKALKPVTNVGTGSQVVAVKRSLGVNTIDEFIAYAKAHPGKLNYAVAGTNNISHLAPVLLFARTGVDLVIVPSRSEPQAISDLKAGNVDFYFGNTSVLLALKDDPAIKLLAVGTATRVAAAPELPTVSESVPGFVFASWNGFMVPAATPDDVVDKLRNELAAFVKTPEISGRLRNLGIVPGGETKEEVAAVFDHDRKAFAEAVRAAGIPQP